MMSRSGSHKKQLGCGAVLAQHSGCHLCVCVYVYVYVYVYVCVYVCTHILCQGLVTLMRCTSTV
jgi:hypothetical protein